MSVLHSAVLPTLFPPRVKSHIWMMAINAIPYHHKAFQILRSIEFCVRKVIGYPTRTPRPRCAGVSWKSQFRTACWCFLLWSHYFSLSDCRVVVFFPGLQSTGCWLLVPPRVCAWPGLFVSGSVRLLVFSSPCPLLFRVPMFSPLLSSFHVFPLRALVVNPFVILVVPIIFSSSHYYHHLFQ